MDPAAIAAAAASALGMSAGIAPALPGPPPFPGAHGALPGPPGLPGQDLGSIADLGEEEARGGLKLTSDKRQALMNRLAQAAGLAPQPTFAGLAGAGAPAAAAQAAPAAPAVRVDPAILMEQGILGPSSPIPTPCLLLKNMFNPAEEEGEAWDTEIAEDVAGECSKYGQVVHCHVDKHSKGFVYLKFATQEGSAAAQRALHGRWFAGRQVAAEFQFAHAYQQAFRV